MKTATPATPSPKSTEINVGLVFPEDGEWSFHVYQRCDLNDPTVGSSCASHGYGSQMAAFRACRAEMQETGVRLFEVMTPVDYWAMVARTGG